MLRFLQPVWIAGAAYVQLVQAINHADAAA